MKKAIIAMLVILISFSFVYAKKEKKKVEPITYASQVIEGLAKHGIKGEPAKEGALAKMLKIVGLIEYSGTVADTYTVAAWKFDSSFGFGIANKLFQMLTLLSDTYVYKEMPIIISIETDTKEDFEKVIKKLKIIMPHIREIGEKDH